jgi:hypothetical protein
MKQRKARKPRAKALNWDAVRELALKLPGVEEGTSYGTPAFRVRGNLFARLHQGGESVVVKIDMAERAMRMSADAEAFYITDHYLRYPFMLVRLSAVSRDVLWELLEESWRRSAPPRVLAAYDDGKR